MSYQIPTSDLDISHSSFDLFSDFSDTEDPLPEPSQSIFEFTYDSIPDIPDSQTKIALSQNVSPGRKFYIRK